MTERGSGIFTLEPGSEAKRHAPATVRNRDAIAAVLRDVLPAHGTVLEIASGSGEHIVHFARTFPDLVWQPSDHDALGLASIAAWSAEAGCSNILPPVQIDASAPQWPLSSVAALLCINMVHIAPWAAAEGLFAGAGRLLPSGAPLILYGPFLEADVPTAPGNIDFDASLKARDPAWGLRDVAALDALATAAGLARAGRISMPANNLTLIWRRD